MAQKRQNIQRLQLTHWQGQSLIRYRYLLLSPDKNSPPRSQTEKRGFIFPVGCWWKCVLLTAAAWPPGSQLEKNHSVLSCSCCSLPWGLWDQGEYCLPQRVESTSWRGSAVLVLAQPWREATIGQDAPGDLAMWWCRTHRPSSRAWTAGSAPALPGLGLSLTSGWLGFLHLPCKRELSSLPVRVTSAWI